MVALHGSPQRGTWFAGTRKKGFPGGAAPINAYDGAPKPSERMDTGTPWTIPGCRTPLFWRRDGNSLSHTMGPEITLPRFDDATDRDPLSKRGRARKARGSGF